MNATTTATARRIGYLRKLIEHPSTPEGERDNAWALLVRLEHRFASDLEARRDGYIDRRWYGAKYDLTRGKSLTEIAKMIRADIKLARKAASKAPAAPGDLHLPDPIGDAPAEIKFGVRTAYYSGGGSIDIYLKNIPAEWGWTTVADTWGNEREAATDALRTLAKELKEVMNAYNHNGSDAQVDYFDVRFYGHVMTPEGTTLA